jgi:hypothetical protein
MGGLEMHFRIRWARALIVTGSLAVLVAGAMPASASAHVAKGAHGAKRSGASQRRHSVSTTFNRATAKTGSVGKRTLIFGGGDTVSGVDPNEPLSDLQTILADAGYGVDVSSTLPTNLSQYNAIWFVGTSALSTPQENELEAYVNSGHGLYLTGERPCCAPLDNADTQIINALVTGGGIQAGGMGDAVSASAPNAVNASVIDDVSLVPNALSTWTPNGPGGMSGVASTNLLTSTNFEGQSSPVATGALWGGSSLTDGAGRLAILMDINWLETQFWDQSTATQMAQNLEKFLLSALPAPSVANSRFAGYAAKAGNVSDANGTWTVPTVNCSEVSTRSAVQIWAGIDGFGNKAAVKAGLGVTCASPTTSPCYYLFTQAYPGHETPVTACSGVAPGDHISADVTNSPRGSSTFITTLTDSTNGSSATDSVNSPNWQDASAECVTQLPQGPTGLVPVKYKELADFSSVTFTSCSATAAAKAGTNPDTEQLAAGSDGAFSVSALYMGTRKAPLATTVGPSWPALTWSVAWAAA